VAVVESISGDYFPGVRVENASFPLTISAVQNALFCCLSEGCKPKVLFIEDRTPMDVTAFWEKAYSLQIEPLNSADEYSFSPLIKKIQSIKPALLSLHNLAITSESDFPVSALLQTDQGFISGVNIEASIWSRGLCAERIAIAKAISYGLKGLKAMHICTSKGEYGSPCGACRQVLREHLPHHPIHFYQPDGSQTVLFSSDLLPYSFQLSTQKV
jgi:homotetrameric cytidine deaminase